MSPMAGKLLGVTALAGMVAAGPCDIYARGKTPCVAAHSTTRSLYKAYNKPLYEVTRGSDNTTMNVLPLSKGGVANAASQDTFCANTTCLITTIYDQSGNSNHLTAAPPGGNSQGPVPGGGDYTASAIGAPVTLNGQKAYGVFINPGVGYRIDDTNGVATGNDPQSIYAVFDGTHYNDGCCFDYGNAETSNDDTGNGHMQAIYFGTNTVWDKGAGSGPWIMADLENGLVSTGGAIGSTNENDPTQTSRFLTAIVKGNTTNQWAIKGGNAQSGTLSTYYSGPRPTPSYYPMSQEGSILLGIGGDNSNGAQGTFYEGILTRSYASDATEAAVQANIIAAKYAVAPLTSGPAVTVGSTITFRVTTPGFNTRYIAVNGTYNDAVVTTVITSSSPKALKKQGSWKVVTGLGNSGCVSFQSVFNPSNYIRHSDYELYSQPSDGSQLFMEDATFCPQAALNGQGNSIRSWSYPSRWFRHYYDVMYIALNGGPEPFDQTYSYNNDVSFEISSSFIAPSSS